MQPISLLRLFISFGVASFFTMACTANVTSAEQTSGQTTETRAAHLCAGQHVAQDRVAACPAPAGVRPGRACDVAFTCPSPNLLFGQCKCAAGSWVCDGEPPKDYDPYPDCPDEGVSPDAACFSEASKCLPVTASACFTSGVPLCTCKDHAWKC
jgi:hypothetical protein